MAGSFSVALLRNKRNKPRLPENGSLRRPLVPVLDQGQGIDCGGSLGMRRNQNPFRGQLLLVNGLRLFVDCSFSGDNLDRGKWMGCGKWACFSETALGELLFSSSPKSCFRTFSASI